MTAPLPGVPKPPRLNPKKLLLSKWTAVHPQRKEKHFIVTQLLQPEPASVPPLPCVDIVIEAVHSRQARTIAWRELTDLTRWRQGWV
ncbi:MAG: TIGR02450 family Trp-rich protein [Rubrivivax sp.]|nr:TIGR02450 family Trp-rich protein [Rubrivivax sp.]